MALKGGILSAGLEVRKVKVGAVTVDGEVCPDSKVAFW